MVRLLFSAFFVLVFGVAAIAQERSYLGNARLFSNDTLGDGQDRWRTGSLASSYVWGPDWTGELPSRFGQLLELRISGQVISPEALVTPNPLDRPYAGALSAGIHAHFATQQADISAGVDFVVTGRVTQLDELQSVIHDVLNVAEPSSAVTSTQIGNGLHPTLVLEAGRDLAVSENVNFRPFVEGRAGIETLARIGADLTFGQLGQGEFSARDNVTGHRYRIIRQPWTGFSFVLGADVAHVSDSEFLPSSSGVTLEQSQTRLRAGVNWQNQRGASVFYGITRLSEEFEGQPESQLLGSVQFNLKF